MSVLSIATAIITQVPDPGQGEAPPGSDKVLLILKWVAWIAVAICVGGIVFCGAKMAKGGKRGEGGEHASDLGWAMAGCIVIGSAAAIAGALI